jgi:hypothetical protein
MLGRDDHGFVDINAMALNATISGPILADPDGLLGYDDRIVLGGFVSITGHMTELLNDRHVVPGDPPVPTEN